MSPLAAELVDLIISFLHPIPLQCGNGDTNFLDKPTAATVGRCALVCRSWVPSSRRVLFYRLHIRQYVAHGFAKLFNRPQRLTFLPFIREIAFLEGLAENRWMLSVFPKIAKHLPASIRMIVLSVNYTLSPTILPCPPLSTITHLEILHTQPIRLAEVIRCVASFPTLEAFKFWGTDWTDIVLPNDTMRPTATLQSLDLRCNDMEPLLAWIRTGSSVISTLALYIQSHMNLNWKVSFRYAAQYIGALGPSLTSLSLAIDYLDLPSDLATLLSDDFLRLNTRLRALSFRANQSQVIMLLKKIQLPSSLKSIAVNVPLHRPAWHAPLSHWEELDSMIAPFSSIQRLNIIYCGDYTLVEMNRLRSHPDEIPTRLPQLPLCAARGIITEDVEIDRLRGWF
ncbi:hypothetical protein C8R44DRAFT_731496 [Mycena epipterygia]|nr:hypothetical protein C8R44DRAFT_731496 [Mycena epipterygia]